MKRLLLVGLSLLLCGFTAGGGGVGSGTYTVALGSPPVNWTPSLDMVLFWDAEATGDKAQDWGAGGQDDFVDASATKVLRTSSFAMQGSQSAQSVFTGDPYMFCSDATCTGIDFATASSFTIAWWHMSDVLPTALEYAIFKRIANSSGYSAWIDGTIAGDPLKCRIDYPSTVAVATWDISAVVADTWYYYACTFDDQGTNMVITPYRNAVADSTASTTADYTATSNDAYITDSNADTFWQDEMVIDGVAWTIEELGRSCSLGVEGHLGRCDATTPANYLTCTSNADCTGIAICDTADAATDDTYCPAADDGAGGAGCCMGRNSTYCNGQQLTACNAGAPE